MVLQIKYFPLIKVGALYSPCTYSLFFKEMKFSAVRECDSKPAGMVVVMYVSGQVVVEKEALPSDMLL
jgi:hypothetical protein